MNVEPIVEKIHDSINTFLEDLFEKPESERTQKDKRDAFTWLTYEPKENHPALLADIAKLFKTDYSRAVQEFEGFEYKENTRQEAAIEKYCPERKVEKVLHRKAVDANSTPSLLDPPETTTHERITVCLSDVEAEPVNWLWRNYFPLGSGCLLTGDPDSGKTWLALDLAARLSRGTRWIDGTEVGEPANTIYLSVEDSIEQTIRPRFNGLGGDPEHFFAYTAEHTKKILDLSSDEGLKNLEDEIEFIGDVKLVVVDPMIDFSPSTNPNKNEAVRALLSPLIEMAKRRGFVLLMMGHLNKAQSMNAIYRAGGSTSGWVGKCRAAFIVFRDKDNDDLRHVVRLKANLAEHTPPQLEFTLNNWQMTARVTAKEDMVSADEHLNPNRGKTGPKPREKTALLEFLDGLFEDRAEIPANEIVEAVKANGFSPRTLKRAKSDGGYISKRVKMQGGEYQWFWVKVVTGTVEKTSEVIS